jgi:hypothetical protein
VITGIKMKKKKLRKTKAKFPCSLCKENLEEFTVVRGNNMQEFCLCESCRRTIIVQLLEQYLLEHDMQPFNNEITDKKLLSLEKKINKNSK